MNILQRYSHFLLIIFAASFAVFSYSQAIHFNFISDDKLYVAANTLLYSVQPSNYWHIFLRPFNPSSEYLPVRDLSFWLELIYRVNDPTVFNDPSVYRIDNIVLYLIGLPLVYSTTSKLWRYFRPDDLDSLPWAAAIITALFAIHPALVESVVWISGRKYILPNLFSLLTFWLALEVKMKDGFNIRYAFYTLICFVFVMFSKTSFIGVAPAIAILWLLFWLDIPVVKRKLYILLFPLFLMVIALIMLNVFIHFNNGVDSLPYYFGLESVYRSFAILGGLARLCISPFSRHFFYPVFDDPLYKFLVMLGVLMTVAVIFGFVQAIRKRSFVGFLLVLFFLLCLPYLQIIPAKPPSLLADRYVSLAIWPFMMLLVLVIWQLKSQLRILLFLVLALTWSYQTFSRPADWSNYNSLVKSDYVSYPYYYLPAYYFIVDNELPKGSYYEARQIALGVSNTFIRDVFFKMINSEQAINTSNPPSQEAADGLNSLQKFSDCFSKTPSFLFLDNPTHYLWYQLSRLNMGQWKAYADKHPNNTVILSAYAKRKIQFEVTGF